MLYIMSNKIKRTPKIPTILRFLPFKKKSISITNNYTFVNQFKMLFFLSNIYFLNYIIKKNTSIQSFNSIKLLIKTKIHNCFAKKINKVPILVNLKTILS